jgi:cardiolipin synthase
MPSQETRPATSSGTTERDVWVTIPNLLTVARLVAILPFAYLATQGKDRTALIVFLVAGLTDTLDGTIARRFGQTSKIGRLLDPLADKLFTGVAFVVLSAFRAGLSSVPLWVMAAVLLRDVLILVGSLMVYRTSRNSDFHPSIYGKLNTFIEIGIVVLFLAQSDFTFLTALLPVTYFLLLISLLVSAGDYLRVGMRMMRD